MVNLVYENAVYQLRFVEDTNANIMDLSSILFEFEDLSV